jgi:hypothetical protein
MTAPEAVRRPVGEPPATSVAPQRRASVRALTLLKIEVWLLVLIPNHLVVGALGGIGQPSLVLGVGLFLVWAVCVLAPGLRVARTCVPVRVVLGVFWIATLLSFAVMNFHAVPSDQLLNSERFLITMVGFTGVALTAAEGLRDRDEVLELLRTAVAAVAVMALIGILQFRAGFDATKYLERIPFLTPRGDLTLLKSRGGFARPSSTALHPIEFGVILGCTLAFAVHLSIYDKIRPRWKRWVPLGLIGLAIPVSISRSALLVTAVVLVFFFAGAPRAMRLKGGAVACAAILFIFMAVPGMIGTMKGYFLAGNKDTSIQSRTSSYAYTAPFIHHSPLLGRGPGTFLPSDFKYLDNQYLLTLVEMGLVGLAAAATLFVTSACLGRGSRHRSSTEADRNLGQMFAGAGFAAFVSAATYDALSFPTFTVLVALYTGLAGAVWCQAREARRRSMIARRAPLNGPDGGTPEPIAVEAPRPDGLVALPLGRASTRSSGHVIGAATMHAERLKPGSSSRSFERPGTGSFRRPRDR